MIVGTDNDDSDIFTIQRDFLNNAGITTLMVGLMIAIKGTRLWNRLETEGRLLSYLEPGDQTGSAVTNVIQKLMRKVIITFPWLIEHFLYFKSLHEFAAKINPAVHHEILIADGAGELSAASGNTPVTSVPPV